MAIPYTTAIEVLDAERNLMLEDKHALQEIIDVAERGVRQLNIELASISAAMNALDTQER